jgi:group I intron endonuclease
MNAGVYTITSPSGGVYVGSAVDFTARWRVHRHHLRCGTHHNIKLQNAAAKYGVDALIFKKLIVCLPDNAVMYEQIAIDALCPRYNIARVAGRTTGYRHTNETKEIFKSRRPSYGNLGKRQTDEARAKISAAKRGVPNIAARGRVLSDETKEKLRAAATGKKYGPMSAEHKAKIGAANKARAAERKAKAAA